MEIHYCDLCSCPLKENEIYYLYIANEKEILNSYNDYKNIFDSNFTTNSKYNYSTNSKSNNNYYPLAKEICLNCKTIIDKIFELRLEKISELTEELTQIWDSSQKKHRK